MCEPPEHQHIALRRKLTWIPTFCFIQYSGPDCQEQLTSFWFESIYPGLRNLDFMMPTGEGETYQEVNFNNRLLSYWCVTL